MSPKHMKQIEERDEERDIIVTAKKNIVFSRIVRLIQCRYKVLYITVRQAKTVDENKTAS